MVHTHFYTIKAKTYSDLGLQTGMLFAQQAHEGLEIERQFPDWENRKKRAEEMLVITNKWFPQYVEELEGYAAGANLPALDLWTMCVEDDAHDPEARCTNITTNNGTLIGHSEDTYEPGHDDSICILKKVLPHIATTELFLYNTLGGTSIGFNSYGFVQAINTLYDSQVRMGIPKNIIGRYLLDTKNPEEDIKKLENVHLASGYNHVFLYPDNQVAHIEFSGDQSDLVVPELPFIHSNHCIAATTVTVDEAGTVSRLQRGKELSKAEMTIEEMKNLLMNDELGPVKSINNERTIGRMIIDRIHNSVHIWLGREEVKGWVEYPL